MTILIDSCAKRIKLQIIEQAKQHAPKSDPKKTTQSDKNDML
jgi:hypothetical protein